LIPIVISFLFAVEELYGTQYQNGSFFLINVGSGFHCLVFSFFFFFTLISFHLISGSCAQHVKAIVSTHQILRPYRLPCSFGGMQAIARQDRVQYAELDGR